MLVLHTELFLRNVFLHGKVVYSIHRMIYRVITLQGLLYGVYPSESYERLFY